MSLKIYVRDEKEALMYYMYMYNMYTYIIYIILIKQLYK